MFRQVLSHRTKAFKSSINTEKIVQFLYYLISYYSTDFHNDKMFLGVKIGVKIGVKKAAGMCLLPFNMLYLCCPFLSVLYSEVHENTDPS